MFFKDLTLNDYKSILNNQIVIRSSDPYELHALASFARKQLTYKKEIFNLHRKDITKQLTPEQLEVFTSDLSAFFIENIYGLFLYAEPFYRLSKDSPITLGFQWDVIQAYVKHLTELEEKHLFLYAIGEIFIWKYNQMWRNVVFEQPKSASNWFDDFYQKSLEYFSLWEELKITTKLSDLLKDKHVIEKELLSKRGTVAANKRHEKSRKTKIFALDLYNKDKDKFKSKKQGVRQIHKKVIEFAKQNEFHFIDEYQAIDTIYSWVLNSEK